MKEPLVQRYQRLQNLVKEFCIVHESPPQERLERYGFKGPELLYDAILQVLEEMSDEIGINERLP